MFIHDAVVDHINCGANEVEVTQVMIEIKNLWKKNEKGETGFEEKFKVSEGQYIIKYHVALFVLPWINDSYNIASAAK